MIPFGLPPHARVRCMPLLSSLRSQNPAASDRAAVAISTQAGRQARRAFMMFPHTAGALARHCREDCPLSSTAPSLSPFVAVLVVGDEAADAPAPAASGPSPSPAVRPSVLNNKRGRPTVTPAVEAAPAKIKRRRLPDTPAATSAVATTVGELGEGEGADDIRSQKPK